MTRNVLIVEYNRGIGERGELRTEGLRIDPARPEYIETEWGVGYRFRD